MNGKDTSNSAEQRVKVLPIMPGVIVIAALSAVVFLAAIFVMSRYGIIRLPAFIENIISSRPDETKTESSPWDELLSSLGGKNEITSFSPERADYSSVRLSEILPTMIPDGYFQLYSLTENAARTKEISVMRLGEKCRLTSYTDGEAKLSVVYDGSGAKITDTGGSLTYKKGDAFLASFNPESEVGIPSVSRLAGILNDYENDADGTYSVMYDSVSGIFRVTCVRQAGIREEYDVRADLGVIIACRMYAGEADSPYYDLTTTALLTEVSYLDEQFVLD